MKDYSAFPDDHLMDLWLSGDSSAGGVLCLRYYKAALLFCLKKYQGNKEKSEDLVHKTFEKIIRQVQVKKNASIVFKEYLFSSLATNFAEDYRTKKRRTEILDRLQKKDTYDQQEAFFAKNKLQLILKLLKDPIDKAIFSLLWEGYQYDEIANKLNLSFGAVRGRIERRRKLIRILKHV